MEIRVLIVFLALWLMLNISPVIKQRWKILRASACWRVWSASVVAQHRLVVTERCSLNIDAKRKHPGRFPFTEIKRKAPCSETFAICWSLQYDKCSLNSKLWLKQHFSLRYAQAFHNSWNIHNVSYNLNNVWWHYVDFLYSWLGFNIN